MPLPEPVPFVPDPAAELPSSAEIVIVGAGMVGAVAAHELAAAGMRPLVIEAGAPASGASGRNAGMALAGLGGHFPRVTRLVQEAGGRSILDYTAQSLDILESWETTLPGGIEWDRNGSLDLALEPVEVDHLNAMAAAQANEGLEVEVIGPRELGELAPAVDTAAVAAAKWTRQDATLNPFRLVYGLLEAAVVAGARIVTGVRVDGLTAAGGRVTGVRTTHGEVSAGAVLLAANAWTPFLVPHLAHNLTPIREHVCVTDMLPTVLRHGFETNQTNEYWRQMRSGEVVIGGFAVADEAMGIDTYDTRVRPNIPPLLAGLLGRVHPALRDARIVRCWTGLLDFASIEIPMAGALPAADGTPLPGGYLVAGLTGHGHPYAPIFGRLLAELIVEGVARTLPLDPFDPRRYVGRRHERTWLAPFQGYLAPV